MQLTNYPFEFNFILHTQKGSESNGKMAMECNCISNILSVSHGLACLPMSSSYVLNNGRMMGIMHGFRVALSLERKKLWFSSGDRYSDITLDKVVWQ